MAHEYSPIAIGTAMLSGKLAVLAHPPKDLDAPDLWETALWPIIYGLTRLLEGLHRLTEEYKHLTVDMLEYIGEDLDELATVASQLHTHLLQTADAQMRSEAAGYGNTMDRTPVPNTNE